MAPCCSICLSGLSAALASDSTESRVCAIDCGHAFHLACLEEWYSATLCTEDKQVPLLVYRETRMPALSCPNCREWHYPKLFELKFTTDDLFLSQTEREEADAIEENIAKFHRLFLQKESDIFDIDAEILTLEKNIDQAKEKNLIVVQETNQMKNPKESASSLRRRAVSKNQCFAGDEISTE